MLEAGLCLEPTKRFQLIAVENCCYKSYTFAWAIVLVVQHSQNRPSQARCSGHINAEMLLVNRCATDGLNILELH